MDEFINEVFIKVFIMNKADSMTRVLDPFPQPSTHKSPASETPAPAVPPAFRNQDPESAHDPTPDTSAQPDPDAAIGFITPKSVGKSLSNVWLLDTGRFFIETQTVQEVW